MKIVILLEQDDPTIGARIEGVTKPNPAQAVALRDLATLAGHLRAAFTEGTGDQT